MCWVSSLESKGIHVPDPGQAEGSTKKAMQQRLQEHKRIVGDERARKRARTLPSLSNLPLGFGRPNEASIPTSLSDLVMRAPRPFQPACAGTALPPRRLTDG
eukprot:893913-Pyramimonas_sp.AAC.1